jgi:acyl carrier protein
MTLLELIIACAILLILSSAALPVARRFVEHYGLKPDARILDDLGADSLDVVELVTASSSEISRENSSSSAMTSSTTSSESAPRSSMNDAFG